MEKEFQKLKDRTQNTFDIFCKGDPNIDFVLMCGVNYMKQALSYRSCESPTLLYLPLWEVNVMLDRDEYDDNKYTCALFNVYKRIEKTLKARNVDVTEDTFEKRWRG